MDLPQTISAAIEKIFTTLSSIVKTGTLQGKTSTTFNFQTGQAETVSSNKTIEFILLSDKLLDDGTSEQSLLFRTRELNPSLYSSLAFEGNTYRFEEVEVIEAATIIKVRKH